MMTPAKNSHNPMDSLSCNWEDFSVIANSTIPFIRPTLHYDVGVNSVHFPNKGDSLPKPEDMQYWIVAAVVLILLRRLVERIIFIPLGQQLGIKQRPINQIVPCRIPSALQSLEKGYLLCKKKVSNEAILKLSSKTGLTVREVQRWLRKRQALDSPSTLVKFSESGWRFLCYVASTSIGIWTLWDKPWVWDAELCWKNYPNHHVPIEMWMYYLYGAGLYLSFLVTQAFDVKRKDFWEMFVHHIVTIILMVVSWNLNLTRIGLYTLVLHDCADVFLEAAKMANYIKKQNLSTGIFVIFTLVWIITRLIIYPKKVVFETTYNMLKIENSPPHYLVYMITCLLTILFGLHLFWTYFICKVAISALNSGTENHKDARSCTESDAESDLDECVNNVKRKHERMVSRSLSLQNENGQQLLARINIKQRAIMKRISVEIM